jgi:TatD DNase family protein
LQPSQYINLDKARALIVDDNPQSLDILVGVLTSFGLRNVTRKADGKEAQEELKFHQYDLILTNLPYVGADAGHSTELLEWEPGVAIVPGPTGLETIETVLRGLGPARISADAIGLEVGERQAETVAGILEETGFPRTEIRKDLAGIGRIVTISTRIRRLPGLLDIAERFPNVYCSVGTHPHHADEEDGIPASELIELARHPKVVALGEAGLDYFYEHGSREAQERGFRAHIAAARETGLPLVIHTRDADEDCGRILEDEVAKGPFAAVLHCYTGGRELAMKAIGLGLSISFTGILTFKKSETLRELAAELPADRIMVETDAPYLAPGKFRGKRNEPSYVVEVAKVLAQTRGVSLEEISRQTTENFFRLFSKVPAPKAGA